MNRFPGAGAYHGIELSYLFESIDNHSGTMVKEQSRLVNLLQKTWADFARDPELGLPWPKVGSSNNLGIFGKDAQIQASDSSLIDQNCELYEPLYRGRA
jgi:carboxylesterase type B